MKIAWFSPFHRDGGDIARYSAAACGGLLADGHEVTVLSPDLRDAPSGARTDIPIVALDDFDREAALRRRPGFDLAVFNLGADDCGKIYELSREWPGVVVLHDLLMRPFFEAYCLRDRGGDRPGLLRLMEYCHGSDGRAWMEAVLDGRIADARSEPHATEYHMARAAVAGALGVVVHSECCRARIAELAGAPVVRLAYPAPAEALGGDSPAAAPGRPIRLLSVGSIHRHTLLDMVIECLQASPALRGRVTYTVVGDVVDSAYRAFLDDLVARLGLAESVRFVGPKYGADLYEEIGAADVVVNLRNPHLGAISWSLVEAMCAARPTLVLDRGFDAEIPDGAVRKIFSREELTSSLEVLCADAGRRRALGEAARCYAREAFDARRYGRDIAAFAEGLRSLRPVLDLTDRVGLLVREMTDGPGARVVLERVAEEIGWLADDDPAASAPRRRRAATGDRVARADRAA